MNTVKNTNLTQTNLKHPTNTANGARTHRTYLRTEQAIFRGLNKALATRSISFRTADLCHLAGISTAAFYLHYHNVDEALRGYEQTLLSEFQQNLPPTSSRHLIYHYLLSFIRRHRGYFLITVTNHDHFLLSRLLRTIEPRLIGTIKSKSMYRCNLRGIVETWILTERCSLATIDTYAKLLTRARLIYYD